MLDRRRFTGLAGSVLAAGLLPRPLAGVGSGRDGAGDAPKGSAAALSRPVSGPSQPPDLQVDADRLIGLLDELARFGATPDGGTHRVAFGDADLEARAWVVGRMEEAGLEVTVDAAGNLLGRREGRDPGLPPLMLGSHIDSVPDGGRYDGPVGSMAAVEIALTLQDAGHTTRHPLEFVIWENEEGGKTGSRAVSGEVEPSEMELPTASGFTIGEGIRRVGGDPDRIGEAIRAPGSLASYLELHVEQGAVLERADVDIGVVEGIVGIERWTATVEGFANHAGTTPMDQRRDALVAAARMVEVVNAVARETPGRQVATVGRIAAEPGAPNVVPGRVTFSVEVRDLDMGKIERVFETLRDRSRVAAAETGTTVSFDRFYVSRAAPTDPHLRDVIEEEASRLGLSTLRMPSGAGHDAQSIALLAPVGMIFVPSEGGISHSPLERTAPEDVVAGATVLLRTLTKLDEEEGP